MKTSSAIIQKRHHQVITYLYENYAKYNVETLQVTSKEFRYLEI